MPNVVVVVPTYNEIENISSIVGRLRQAVPRAHVLVVDDSSPDGTGERAEELAAADPGIMVLHRDQKEGLGKAYLAGFALALERGYDYIAEIDADGSHDPSELPAMIALAKAGNDLVIGSRWVPGGSVKNWPWFRHSISRMGNSYARMVLHSDIRDITAGFRVFRASALRELGLDGVSSQGYCFQVEMAWNLERAGYRVAEHPITFVERSTGRSKMHAGIVAEALFRVTGWGIAATLKTVHR
ncbi:polyprenol monophosphomannose synthase [Salinibacterium sp. NK8237]|uniref:polyprenol monophosphomannose synthase n=1 Tax=Salinibacterium sp. NK8237 TaxID=2792038 RepID=UPI0018CFC10E|nr:polyprenol monophosphomannose synthase [Salinibacterium sp. NK8237]MBH0128948.1 polyprenol monophosphomannose synthase [Salinibacterium sp. NK8237]